MLKIHCGEPDELLTGRAHVCTLRGAQVPSPIEENPLAAFSESPAVLIGPRGKAESKAVPLYPLFKPVTEREPLSLYDGHYGIRVETRQGEQERSYVYYLGTHHHSTDSPACEHLKTLLAKRQISFFLDKEKTAPWTIADSALDYSRRTLEDLLGTKYFPECYLPLENPEREFDAFLRIPEPGSW